MKMIETKTHPAKLQNDIACNEFWYIEIMSSGTILKPRNAIPFTTGNLQTFKPEFFVEL